MRRFDIHQINAMRKKREAKNLERKGGMMRRDEPDRKITKAIVQPRKRSAGDDQS